MRIMESPSMAAAESKRELLQFLKYGLLSCGTVGARERMAAAPDTLPRVARLLKATINPMGLPLSTDDWAMSRAFDDAQKSRNVLVGASGLFKPAPLYANLIMRVGIASGSSVEQGEPKPITSLTLANQVMVPRKSVVIVVTTKDLIRDGGAKAESLLNSSLLDGESAASNAAVAQIIAASTSLTTTGTPATFIQSAMGTLTYSDAQSRYLVLCGPDVARVLAGYQNPGPPGSSPPSGGLLYPNMSVSGGSIGNFGVYVAEAGLNAGEALIVDCGGFACDSGSVSFDFSDQTSLEMDTAPLQTPDSPQNLTSLFQTNSVALRAERIWAFEPLRADAAVLVTGLVGAT